MPNENMHQLSIVCFWFLVGIAVYNTLWTLFTLHALGNRRRKSTIDDRDLPKAAVLLCLRGADSGLRSCLRRLLNQDYPKYELFIAVDSETDPAWDVVQSAIRTSKAENVHVSVLRNRLTTCSLKCSALVQLVDQLDDSHQVIALADADLESHPTWLRELVSPLADPKIGVTFGNRWFMPTQGWFGSLVRQMWNGPGLVVMHVLQIPWAGSLAIRANVFHQGRLRDRWARSIVDDGPIRVAVKAQNLRLHFVPTLIMANREDCSLGYAYNFLRRQMTWTRTYIYGWWMALLASVFLVLGTTATSAILALANYFYGSPSAAFNFAAGVAALVSGSTALWLALDFYARRMIREQGETAPASFSVGLSQLPVVMLVTCFMHVFAAVVATLRRRVVWRGVTYEIRGPSNIRVISENAMEMPLASSAVSI